MPVTSTLAYGATRAGKRIQYPRIWDTEEQRQRDTHRFVAERALERPLASRNEVHHVNDDKYDFSRGNLVICEDQKYHKLLHRRTTALREGGDANLWQCWICRRWDQRENLQTPHQRRGYLAYHSECRKGYRRAHAEY